MKLFAITTIFFSLNLMAATHSAVGSYYQHINFKWVEQAQVLQQGQNLVLQFVTGCAATLEERNDGSLAGSCSIGYGSRALHYTGIIKQNGRSHTLTFKVLDYSNPDLSNEQIYIAYQK